VLHHLELYVGSLPDSVAWWGRVAAALGWEPFQGFDGDWPDGRSWRAADGSYLVLVQSPDLTPYHRRRVGMNHVALKAGGRETVDALVTELSAAGTRLLYPDRHPFAGGPDHYAAFVLDPDGIKVELVAE
jgi:catechol 2,3-dioxygenase-like lactoylglutathione lyase family enzyme